MNGKFVCSICGKDYNDLTNYMNCVSACYDKKLKEEKEAEARKRAEECNAALNGVKQAKAYYEQKLKEFKEKYPAEYEMNFGKSCDCGGDCKCDSDTAMTKEEAAAEEKRYKDIAISYEINGKDEPKISAKVNGKKVYDDNVKNLLNDPEVDWIARMLGLV